MQNAPIYTFAAFRRNCSRVRSVVGMRQVLSKMSIFCAIVSTSKELRKNWARLIQKIYNVNPLLCPKCSGSMRIISLIDDQQLVKKILKHLSLWDVKHKPHARANGPPPDAFVIYDESSMPSADDYIIDDDYPIETYL